VTLDENGSVTCSDGAVFALQTESVRGEGTWHSVMFRPPGAQHFMGGFERPDFELPGGSARRQTMVRRIEKAAREYEARLA
jgi:hypothetical protein